MSKFHENCNFSETEKFCAARFEKLLVPPTAPFSRESKSERFFGFRTPNYTCEAENWHTSSLLCKKILYQISAKSYPITITFEKKYLAVWVIIFFEFLRKKSYYIFGESSTWEALSRKSGLTKRRFRRDMAKRNLKCFSLCFSVFHARTRTIYSLNRAGAENSMRPAH